MARFRLAMITRRTALRWVIWSEVVLCFAIPAYFLAWGVLTFPIWLGEGLGGAGFALVHALCTIGGCGGIWAVQTATTYYLRDAPQAPNWLLLLLMADVGILSLWTEMTGQFAGLDLELHWFDILSTIAPTICTIHVFAVAIRKSSAVRRRKIAECRVGA